MDALSGSNPLVWWLYPSSGATFPKGDSLGSGMKLTLAPGVHNKSSDDQDRLEGEMLPAEGSPSLSNKRNDPPAFIIMACLMIQWMHTISRILRL